MDHPVREIKSVVKALVKGTPAEQERAINTYFVPEAAFAHPFCRVPSFSPITVPFLNYTIESRWLVLMVYRWYRILSPQIDIEFLSVVQDQKTNHLYLQMRQTFTFFFFPIYHATPTFTTVIRLESRRFATDGSALPATPAAGAAAAGAVNGHGGQGSNGTVVPPGSPPADTRYFIASQEDLYQTTEFLKFIAPLYGSFLMHTWQLIATALSLLGALLLAPLSWMDLNQRVAVVKGA